MRVYYMIDGSEYFTDSELTSTMNGLLEQIHLLAVQKLKYQIMWALRSLETEIENSGGAIIIEWNDYVNDSPHIYCKGMDTDLAQKINEIASQTKL